MVMGEKKDIITSAKNPYIQYLQSLLQRKNREVEGKFLIEGLRFVEEAVQAEASIEDIIVSPEFTKKHGQLLRNLPVELPITFIAHSLFKKITGTENPQGIAALVEKQRFQIEDLLDAPAAFILVAEQLQDPGNLGTLIRTADAAGLSGIILTKGTVDLYNPKVLRSTMGSLFHVPILTEVSITDAFTMLRDKGIRLYAADTSTEAVDYIKTDFSGPVALIIGNEAKGISAESRQGVDQLVRIGMPGRAESLNAAVAAGIILFEAVRQRQVSSTCKSSNPMV